MKIKDGFVLRDIAGDTVVIATGEISKTFHGMIRLNSTGTTFPAFLRVVFPARG